MDFLKVQGANGNDLQPLGIIQGTITLGCTDITHQFIVLNSIRTPLILGIDFQKKHGCSSSWTQDGRMQIKWGNAVTINSVATSEEHPIVYAPANICVPPKDVAVLLTTVRGLTIEATESLYKTEPIKGFDKQFPNLLIVPTALLYSCTDFNKCVRDESYTSQSVDIHSLLPILKIFSA